MTPRDHSYGGLSDSWQDDEIREAYERDVAAREEAKRAAATKGWVVSDLGGGIMAYEREVGAFGACQLMGHPNGGTRVIPLLDEPVDIWTDEGEEWISFERGVRYPTMVQKFATLREALDAPVPTLAREVSARLQWKLDATVLRGMTNRAALRADVQAIQICESVPMRCAACGDVLGPDEITVVEGGAHHGTIHADYAVGPGLPYEDLPLCIPCASAEDDDEVADMLENIKIRHLTLAYRYPALVSKARAAVVQAEAAEVTIGRAMAQGKRPDEKLVRFVAECRNRAQRLLGPVQVRAARGSKLAQAAMEAT